jgi:hypothetical protein
VLLTQVVDALAVIGPQTASAEALVLAGSPAAGRAIDAVRRSAEEALHALRLLMDALPGPAEERSPFAPQPGLAELRREAGRRGADGRIAFEMGELGRVPAGVQLVLHHALTAGLALLDEFGCTARVRLSRVRDDVVLAFALDAPATHPRTGAWLDAVRARAALYGGTVGWRDARRLVVRLPVAGGAAR